MTTPPRSLTRQSKVLCAQRRWEVVRTLISDDDELRQIVTQNSSRPAELVLRGRGGVAAARGRAEVDALTQASSEHLIRLLEVVPGEELPGQRLRRPSRHGAAPKDPLPPALLLEHAPGGSLDALLDRRRSIRCGEAVTVLLAVAEGLRALHAAGWSHGSLTARSVVLRGNGCPVVGSLESAISATAESLAADRSAFRALAERVTEAVGPQHARTILATLHMALATANWQIVSSALLELEEPEAVLLHGSEPERERAAPAVAGFAEEPPARASAGTTSFVNVFLDGNPLAELIGAVKQWMSRRRKLMLVVAAPVAVAAAVLAVIPPPPSVQPGSSTASVKPSPVRDADPGLESTAEAKPEQAVDEAASDVRSDDPAVAGAALLNARHGCFAAQRPEPGCLDGVVETGSALSCSDAAALGLDGEAEKRDCRGAVLALDQRWGDAALVAVAPAAASSSPDTTKPASVLMIRTEAGWVLREVYS
jgi:hypothetical protein